MTSATEPAKVTRDERQIDRRTMLIASGAAVAGLAGLLLVRRATRLTAPVFIARNQRYDGPLEQTIRDGLVATGLDLKSLAGKTVLLKPNLVEPTRLSPQMTTHPAVVVAAAEVFRGQGALVTVGEGPGHMRDTEMALVESGMQDALDDARLDFADLNYSEVGWTKNGGRASKLAGFFFPRQVLEADLIVSMPKMKTHHWVGYTGFAQELVRRDPRHQVWLAQERAALCRHSANHFRHQRVAAQDRSPSSTASWRWKATARSWAAPSRWACWSIGTNSTAVDATVGRIMGFDPARVEYLKLAANRLGPVDDDCIEQRGERWQELVDPFSVIDFPHLQQLLAKASSGHVSAARESPCILSRQPKSQSPFGPRRPNAPASGL